MPAPPIVFSVKQSFFPQPIEMAALQSLLHPALRIFLYGLREPPTCRVLKEERPLNPSHFKRVFFP